MKAPREYNDVDTYFHGVTQDTYNRLERRGFQLRGRVFPFNDISLKEAERQGIYHEEWGKGYVYGVEYKNWEHATAGAGAHKGPVLVLGWDGRHDVEPVSIGGGEILVPLEGYKVIGVLDPDTEEYRSF